VFGCKVYGEKMRQGVDMPCFLVSSVTHTDTQRLGSRHLQSNVFAVTYLPESNTEARAECFDMQHRLYSALEYIDMPDGLPLRGTRMSGHLSDDGSLVFTVSYEYFIQALETAGPMEEIDHRTSTGG